MGFGEAKPPRKLLIWLWCGGKATAPEPDIGNLGEPAALQTARVAGHRVSRVLDTSFIVPNKLYGHKHHFLIR
jgi:hypothetical protein